MIKNDDPKEPYSSTCSWPTAHNKNGDVIRYCGKPVKWKCVYTDFTIADSEVWRYLCNKHKILWLRYNPKTFKSVSRVEVRCAKNE